MDKSSKKSSRSSSRPPHALSVATLADTLTLNQVHAVICALDAVHNGQFGSYLDMDDVETHIETGGLSLLARLEAHAAIQGGVTHEQLAEYFLSLAAALMNDRPQDAEDEYRFVQLRGIFESIRTCRLPVDSDTPDGEELRTRVHQQFWVGSESPAVKVLCETIQAWCMSLTSEDHEDNAYTFDRVAQVAVQLLGFKDEARRFVAGLRALRQAAAKPQPKANTLKAKKPRRARSKAA